jgi:TonB family protein
VVVETVIDAEGKVTDAKAVQGDPPLSDAAIEAIKKWRYEPIKAPRGTTLRININFDTRTQHSVSFTGLIASLHSRYEAVRESAARWLGRGRQQLVGHDKADEVVRELNNLLKHEESERVRAAASR